MEYALRFGSIEIDEASLSRVCRQFGVKQLCVFGSVVRGEAGEESDIDMLVEFEPDHRVGVFRFERLAEELTAIAGRRVDLVTKSGLKPWVRSSVLSDARVIYAA